MDGWFGVIGIGVTALGGAVATWATRRTAKDNTAVTGFQYLTTALENRVTRLETAEQRRAELAEKHRGWDELVRDKLHTLGESVPPPPPLD